MLTIMFQVCLFLIGNGNLFSKAFDSTMQQIVSLSPTLAELDLDEVPLVQLLSYYDPTNSTIPPPPQ